VNPRILRATAAVAVLALGACSASDKQSSSTDSTPRPTGTSGRGDGGQSVPVVTTHVVKKALPVTIPAVGTVEAIQTVQIRAQVSGQLASIAFKEGSEVRKGRLLFTIDPRPFEAALAQAEATAARDTATASNQQAERTRFGQLFQQGLIPRDQFEQQTAAATAAEDTVNVDKAAVDTARLNLQYARITAPIGGKTGSLGVHVGDVLRANDTTPMVVINQVAPIYVTFSVPGRYLADIRRYQAEGPLPVEARPQANELPGAPPPAPAATTPDVEPAGPDSRISKGQVAFIDNAVDSTTGTIKLRGTFGNNDRALWPGLFVQVALDLRTETAVVVPAQAVQVSQNGPYVYVVDANRTAQMRPVTIERQQGSEIVIARGLTEGEELITDGQLRVTPGARVADTGGQSPKMPASPGP
jgi:membrane fusion protein, multidrug efflux system